MVLSVLVQLGGVAFLSPRVARTSQLTIVTGDRGCLPKGDIAQLTHMSAREGEVVHFDNKKRAGRPGVLLPPPQELPHDPFSK